MIPSYIGSEESLVLHHKAAAHVPPHMHHSIELIFVTKGTLELGIAAEMFHMEKGDFAIVFPDLIHHYQVFAKGVNTAFFIETVLPPNSQFSMELQKMCPVNPVIKSEHVHPDIRACIQSLNKEEERNPIVDQAFIQIILARSIPLLQMEEKSGKESGDLVYQIVHYIADHFQEDLTLERIGRSLGVNKYSISRVFSGTFHRNFKQYLNEQRLNYACALLENTNRSVIDICLDSGFESQRTFNRVFLEKYRKSPREYRDDYKKKYLIPDETNKWEE